MNFGLDITAVKPPTSIRGGLAYVDGGGWVRAPLMGIPSRAENEYENLNIKYQGSNLTVSAATTATDWIIRFFIYDANGRPLRHETLVGAWTNRDNLLWTIS
ncbi:MAG TPA: hypothetical protein ENH82_05290 [bacterium]|nr:hypothetical protein [bacterium]